MKLGIKMLIHIKDDIEFFTEFPSFLGHPVFGFIIECSPVSGYTALFDNERNMITTEYLVFYEKMYMFPL